VVISRTLRLQVYEHLKELLNEGELRPGGFLDLRGLERDLGISRTPLRDALLRLESEGFVEILPRRGVQIAELTLERIRDIYQIVGALEGSVLGSLAGDDVTAITPHLQRLNQEMSRALDAGDYDGFYERNTAFHDSFLNLSDNAELVEHVRILKQRLYDFPRRQPAIREWEERSTREHDRIIDLLTAGDVGKAGAFLRDVHWSFDVQSPFVRRYYGVAEGGTRATG
jgi:DNA-binding GntR family transcriptional regulator